MSSIDIRDTPEKVNTIVFAEPHASPYTVAHKLTVTRDRAIVNAKWMKLEDSAGFVYIAGAENARNLIKALEKAIELGLLK